jgi:hypothetical protein
VGVKNSKKTTRNRIFIWGLKYGGRSVNLIRQFKEN